MRLGLVPRILIAGGIVVVFLIAEFVLVLHSFQRVRSLTRSEQRAEQSVVAANRVEKLILDVETGTRGYVITRDRGFLEPWRTAQAQLPTETRLLAALAPGPFAAVVERQSQAYVNDWSRPVVALAARSLSPAEVQTATLEGKRRVDTIRSLIDPFLRRENLFATRERERISSVERTGMILGASGIGITMLLFVGIVGYFLRAAIAPLG